MGPCQCSGRRKTALCLLHVLPSVEWPQGKSCRPCSMCATFKRGAFFQIAIAMAFLAVFAFVVPPVALAFAPAKEAFHCLVQDDHGIGRQHHDQPSDHHSSGNAEHKHSHGDAEDNPGCCGIFCVAALAPETRQLVLPILAASDPRPVIDPGIHSPTPDLPFRPPISPPPSI